jgi:hypothetical protein
MTDAWGGEAAAPPAAKYIEKKFLKKRSPIFQNRKNPER